MTTQKIIFRADGNSKIGFGHISRCLALAELLSKDHYLCFAIQEPIQDLIDILKKVVNEVILLPFSEPSSPAFLTELGPSLTGREIVVLDGYHFDTEYEENLKTLALATVSIDDIPSRHFVSDLVFNFCGSLTANDYSKEFYTQLFTGLRYVFLRPPFLHHPALNKKFNNRLFLNMGGSDSGNETLKIINELIKVDLFEEIEVVVGNQYAHLTSLENIQIRNSSIMINQGLTAEEMFNCMNRCAVAIVPPSTVALEFLSTGGLVFLYQTASNQSLQKKYLIENKLAFDYSSFKSTELSEPLFQQSLNLQKKSFDGESISRVQKVFNDLELSCRLSLRSITSGDSEQCFNWANDPEVRKHSYSTGSIDWSDHVKWFDKKMADPNCFYFIAEIADNPVGQIRFDFLKDEEAFQISYLLDQNWRGKGLGYYLITKGVQKLNQLTPLKKVIGQVQKTNEASLKAFQKAGFTMILSKSHPDSFKFELSFTSL